MEAYKGQQERSNAPATSICQADLFASVEPIIARYSVEGRCQLFAAS